MLSATRSRSFVTTSTSGSTASWPVGARPAQRLGARLQRPARSAAHVAAAQKQVFSSFDDMLARSETPLLVDFHATWCGPCHMLSPILVKVGERLKGQVKVVKIDTDKYPQIASRFGIQALPTVVLFRGGQPIDRIEGLLQEQQLVDRVSYYLQGKASATA